MGTVNLLRELEQLATPPPWAVDTETSSIVGGFQTPPSQLEDDQMGGPVFEQHLQTSPAPGSRGIPPTLVNRPRPGPAQDLERRAAGDLRYQEGRDRRAPATARHPDLGPVGAQDLDKQRRQMDKGR